MTHRSIRRTLLAAAALTAAAATATVTAQVPIHSQTDDDGARYGVWGAGADYKCSFHDGMAFVPYLGRDYPVTRSLRWRTVSAKIGATELCTVAAPRARWHDCRAEFDLGGLTEAYDLRLDGVEQTFVLATRPAAAGDLVIRGAVATALSCATRGAEHAALVFADETGTAILGYGAATAVDAVGRRQPMTTAFADGGIALTLDAAWLENATFPIVVDPLLGVFHTISGAEIDEVDLVRDTYGTGTNIWRAATRWTAADDADLFLRLFDDNGGGFTVFADLSASWSTRDPSLGLHRAGACTLLAFSRHFHASDTRKLRFHRHARGDTSTTTSYGLVGTGSAQAWRPDVASDLRPVAVPTLLVVFQREGGTTFYETPTSGVYGCAIDLTGAGSGTAGAPFVIADGIFEDDERPVVGRRRTGTQEWTVAHQVIGNNPMFSPHQDWDIELRRVDATGSVSAATEVGLGNSAHEMAPQLGGYDDDELLGYTRAASWVVGSRPTTVNGTEVVIERRDWNGSGFDLPYGSFFFDPNPNPRNVLCGIDLDTDTMSHWVALVRHIDSGNMNLRVIGHTGRLLHGEIVYLAPGTDEAVDGAVAYDDDSDVFLLAYAANAGGGNVANVDRYAHPTAPAPQLSGLGCGNGRLGWFGSQLIGDANCGVRLDNLGPGAFATVIVGTQPLSTLLAGVPLVHPGCWQLVPTVGAGSLITLPLGFGPTIEYTLPLPETLPATTLYFQGVHFDAAAGEVFTTARLAVPLVK